MTPSAPALPAAPVGVPAWLIRIVAALVGVAAPIVAWIDPDHAIPPGGVQAAVILVFLIIGAIIFLVHLFLAAVHEYGFTMNAVTHIETEAEAEFRQMWPEMKQAYTDAKPALEQVKGAQPVIDALSKDVSELKAKEKATGLDPTEVVQAFETATGTHWPRPGTDTPPPAPPAGPGPGSVAES